MNKIFKIVWSKVRQAYVVVPEYARNNSKSGRLAVAAVAMGGVLSAMGSAYAATDIPGTYVDPATYAQEKVISLKSNTDSFKYIMTEVDGQVTFYFVANSGNSVVGKIPFNKETGLFDFGTTQYLLDNTSITGGASINLSTADGSIPTTSVEFIGDENVTVTNEAGTGGAPGKIKFSAKDTLTKVTSEDGSIGVTKTELADGSINYDLHVGGYTFAGDTGSDAVDTGKTVKVAGGPNVTTVEAKDADGNSTITVNLDDTVVLTTDGSLTIGGTVIENSSVQVGDTLIDGDKVETTTVNTETVNAETVNVGDTIIDGDKVETTTVNTETVNAETVNVGDTIINGDSVTTETVETTNLVMGGQTITVTNAGPTNIAGTEINRFKLGNTYIATMDDGLKFKGDDTTVITKKLNEQMEITGGATGNLTAGNIGVVSDSGKLVVKLAEAVNLGTSGSVTMGDTVVNNSGLSIGGKSYVTSTGINANNTKIVNVAAGSVSESSTDAINGSQLYTVEQKVDAGWELQASGTKVKDVVPTSKVANFKGDGSMITVSADGTDVKIAADAAAIVDAGNAVVYDDSTKAQVTLGGSGGTIITNVADGAIAENSTDAINGGQLYSSLANQEISYKANGGTANSVKLSDGLDFTNGTNTTASVAADGVVSFSLNKDVVLGNEESGYGSVTMGDTVINNNGLTITGGPSVTSTGIDAGSKVITNVAAGVNSTDAVNMDQLQAAQAAATTHYYSVKTDITDDVTGQDNNYDNDGATGLHALAAGVMAKATKENATSLGYRNTASGEASLASGYQNTASGTDAIALGVDNRAVGASSISLGDANEASGDNAIALGGDNMASAASATAIGLSSTASAASALALGNSARALDTSTIAIGTGAYAGQVGSSTTSAANAVAIGTGAYATKADAVAIGSDSLAARAAGKTDSGAVSSGYDPATKAASTSTNSTWRSTKAAFSVGDTPNGVTRQITGVAAGLADTDAVNVAQLKAAQAAANVHYYSVNSTKTDTGSNYNSDGATGTDALAAGVADTASGNYSTAVGYNNTASGLYSSAIGSSNIVAAGTSVAVGYNNNLPAGMNTAVALGINNKVQAGTSGNYPKDNLVLIGSGNTITNGDMMVTRDTIVTAIGQKNNVKGTNATVIGASSNSIGQGSVAVGFTANADATNGGTSTSGSGAVAVGYNVTANGSGAVALGRSAQATGNSTTALGHATASSDYAVAVGDIGTTASGGSAIAIGRMTTASGSYSNAIGYNATASGNYTTAIGYSAKATGAQTMALGIQAQATEGNAIAVGTNAKATAASSVAAGPSAQATQQMTVALGQAAIASQTGSVAIGAQSVTGDTAPTSASYSVLGKALTFAGNETMYLFSVGSDSLKRRITNVAAGNISADSTDAINGSQLYAVSEALVNGGMKFAADDYVEATEETPAGPTVDKKLGETLQIVGDDNITTAVASGKIQVKLNKAVDLTEDGSVTMGDTVINNDGMSIGDGTTIYNGGASFGDITINNENGGTINNLSNTTWNPDSIVSGQAATEDQVKAAVEEASEDVITKGLDFAGDSGDDIHKDLGSKLEIVGGATDLTENNIGVVSDGEKLAVKLSKDLDLGSDGSITIGDTIIEDSSVQVGDTIIDGEKVETTTVNAETVNADTVNAETVNVGDTVINGDSVTTETVNADTVETTNLVMGGQTITVSNEGPTNLAGAQINRFKLGDTYIATMDDGLKFKGDDTTVITKKLNEQLEITGGATGNLTAGNIGVVSDSGKLVVKLAEAVNLGTSGSVTMGDTVVNNSGLSIGGKSYVSSTGINANSTKIINVAAGTVSETSTDAVNGSQLYTVEQKVDAGWELQASGTKVKDVVPTSKVANFKGDGSMIAVSADGTDVKIAADAEGIINATNAVVYDDSTKAQVTLGGTSGTVITNVADGAIAEDSTDAINGGQLYNSLTNQEISYKANNGTAKKVKLSDGLDFTNGTNTTASVDVNGKVSFSLNKEVDLTSDGKLTVGDTVINNSGLSIDGKSYVSSTGINANGTKIVNVLEGTVSETSTDAVNGSQLYAVQQLAGAHNTVAAGDNITVSEKKLDNGGIEYTVATSKDLILGDEESGFGSVTVGDTVIDKDGMTIGAGTTILNGGATFGGITINNEGSGTIKGLSNLTWDPGNITSGQAATEDQLKAATQGLTGAGMDFKGDGDTVIHKKLGEQLDIVGGATELTEKNIGVVSENGKLVVKLSKNLDLGSDGTISMGDTKIDGSSVTTKTVNAETFKAGDTTITNEGLTINNGPSVTINGIDAGNKRIVNVSDGVADSDAATVGQVNKAAAGAKTEVKAGAHIASVDLTTAEDGHSIYTINAKDMHVSGGSISYDKDGNGILTINHGDATETKIEGFKNNVTGLDSVATALEDNKNLKVSVTTTEDGKTNTKESVVDLSNLETKQSINNTQNIQVLDTVVNEHTQQINRLDNRLDKVGAGAAALAGMHPLDYDPHNKLSFSAGVGVYRSEKAAAVGMFYRPSERVMFNIGSTVGNDNNMVSMGLNFALDRRVKLQNGLESEVLGKAAQDNLRYLVKELQTENAAIKADNAEMKAEIAELRAMVTALAKK